MHVVLELLAVVGLSLGTAVVMFHLFADGTNVDLRRHRWREVASLPLHMHTRVVCPHHPRQGGEAQVAEDVAWAHLHTLLPPAELVAG